MAKYVIGIDYGTLSGRAVLVDAATGKEVAEAVLEYAHAVMEDTLPNGERLPQSYALQHPQDYLDVLSVTVPKVMSDAKVSADDVVGLGIDFTACTLLPLGENGYPLCLTEKYKDNKHAYVKLWKHHAAQYCADDINALAEERGEKWLPIYGGKISSEWAFPKILQILREAPEVYNDTYRFAEAADWLSWMLTGKESHSAVFAGFKWLWNAEDGYPSNDFLSTLDKRLDGIVGTKVSKDVTTIEGTAGVIGEAGAKLTGLKVGTPVALPQIDAHAAMPALNITGKGDLMVIVGTSACHIFNSMGGNNVKGICGYVKDGVFPDTYTYEAGQAAVGDIFDWFVKNCVPSSYAEEAKERGINIHKLLREKASKLTVGEHGLLALDWWNGNRSVLVNSSLKGMILGMDMQTKPEEIYRALIEATAYGLRVIVDRCLESGVVINNVCAAGGIAQKDEMMMQIYADVLNRRIDIAGTTQAAALGSAIYATVAAGLYSDVTEASRVLSRPHAKSYYPIAENVERYGKLYAEYKKLHDYFGEENKVMERL